MTQSFRFLVEDNQSVFISGCNRAILTEELARADERFVTIAADNPDVTRLMTLPGVGSITATAYVAALDDAARFSRAGQVASSTSAWASGG